MEKVVDKAQGELDTATTKASPENLMSLKLQQGLCVKSDWTLPTNKEDCEKLQEDEGSFFVKL